MLTMLAKIESLTMAETLGVSLLGFAIVFFVLVSLMAMISLLRFAMSRMEAPKETAPAPTAAPAAAPAPVKAASNMVPAKGSQGEIKLHNVDDKTAALVMAIVADEMKAPLNELRFLSIKEK